MLTRLKELDIECPKCGFTFPGTIYEIVNAKADPEIKQQILSGEFNRITCPKCQYSDTIHARLFYHDPEAKLAFWVYPEVAEPERIRLQVQFSDTYETAIERLLEKQKALEIPAYIRQAPLIFGIKQLRSILQSYPS
ncbi:MAG: CpXC domain-containing protein [Nitrososphaera sp.]|nr:CpXC domain-containing protein [Nitrososphaera sp.]